MGIREAAGRVLGVPLAAATYLGSWARHGRLFHPEGSTFLARVDPVTPDDPAELGRRLSGPALVRLSEALWRGRGSLPDVLGCAIRFGWSEERAADGRRGSVTYRDDQDLLFATIRSPFTLPFSPLSTRTSDFMANDYYAVAPFRVRGAGRVKLRLVPVTRGGQGASRRERLLSLLGERGAGFTLEMRKTGHPGQWRPVAVIQLLRETRVDQEALRFSPFLDGRGVYPAGLVHALRWATYPASQLARRRGR